MLPTLGVSNETTKDWRKLLVKHQLDSVQMNEVTKMNSHEVRFVKTVEGNAVVPKTELEQFEDPHSEPIRNKTVVLADVYDLIPDFTDHHPSHEHHQFIIGVAFSEKKKNTIKFRLNASHDPPDYERNAWKALRIDSVEFYD
ncbi:hypothetical protein DAPPUDRAFT_329167 [Daphnia pulex]|uniref:Uncharacterized protein n=1 Tax=Daphnia pulex TaxID=6669 RepID=E9HFV6_DAPPU|nr:hypothetical protein DAPPUDRAFT_329167 [Daphnia pulex]|eukprot:EFX69402.1 hypothetical protein DAPPUDRAFT_329167 [Daphnia pulex]